ncbi:hypothetical protein GMLC_36140 [Geomonas limicola]|uniref:T6SS Phospholipase effector Tle1-like catalytic domain-containing protein n=2 Tax=Geomonas limicola TaxID=2740186 RepID=A0A6V8NBN8_9BACT|nr:hypothetical protein GMLC_36140 [Geomonas limicola]
MARNIIICCDGTGNQFDSTNTSVVRIVQSLDRDPTKQRLYYDPGVGTMPEPGVWGKVQQKVSLLVGLAVGHGLMWKVQQAYTYLMNIWEPGDRIFLFGFSRGAYTVRVLAGMLHTMGLLPKGNDNLVPYVAKNYQALKRKDFRQWKTLCDSFRWTFARPMPGRNDRRCPVHFMGVWDTVSSVGLFWTPPAFPFTTRNPSIGIIRHAVSIDERRCFFRQNQMEPESEQNLKEYWFPGVHSDVGGGYPEVESSLWREPFEWILEEARKSDLVLLGDRVQAVRQKSSHLAQSSWDGPQHESLKGPWWLLEFMPKPVWNSRFRARFPQCGFGRHRIIPEKALIHSSTIHRLNNCGDYHPPNISDSFRQQVATLRQIPEAIEYVP